MAMPQPPKCAIDAHGRLTRIDARRRDDITRALEILLRCFFYCHSRQVSRRAFYGGRKAAPGYSRVEVRIFSIEEF